MKFTTFLKIFAIALAGFVGAIGVGVGIMAIAGAFNEKIIQPDNLAFEFQEYKVDDDFVALITTTTADVTKTEVSLSFPNASEVVEKDGKISDGVIIIPKTVNIGEKFTVELVKKINDEECGGEDWIAGGHSVLRATSVNPNAESARTSIHVDVPVYDVEMETKVGNDNADVFVLDTNFYANLKFYPERSGYQYSFDGKNGYDLIPKNTYYMLATGNDEYISQVDFSNEFHAKAVGKNSKIDGYVFSRTITEERILAGISDLTGQEKYNAILQNLRNLINSQGEVKQVYTTYKLVDVVDIDVDKLVSTGDIDDVFVATKYRMYANNGLALGDNNIDLEILLKSNYSENVNLQSKLKNVAITYLYRQGNNYYPAYGNSNDIYNVVQIPEGGVGQTKIVSEDDVEYTYFFPVITSNVANYHWEFAISRFCDADSIYVQIKYFDNEKEIEVVQKSFSTKVIVSNQVSWSDVDGVDLKIIDGENPIYQDYDVKSKANVPQNNLYRTKKYFAYSDSNQDLSNYIHCLSGVTYYLGSQSFVLYELTDGIIKPYNKSAHGLSLNVIFATIKTDYEDNPILEDGKYILNQYSQDNFGAVSAIPVTISKTLYGLTYKLLTSGTDEELIVFDGDEEDSDALAYVHNSIAPFDVLVSYNTLASDISIEEAIFRQAVVNGEISVVAKVNSSATTDVVYVSNVTEEQYNGNLTFRFSLAVGELPAGTTDIKVTLYVVYDKGLTEPDLYKVDNYNNNKVLSFIEIYNGAAVTFAFNLNICGEGEDAGQYLTSEDRRVEVETLLSSHSYVEDGQTKYIVDNIETNYSLDNIDISQYLFQSFNGVIDFGNTSIVVQDKHGQYPLSALYSLESTNPSVLIVTNNNTLVFVGQGDVELKLVHKNNEGIDEVKDILYFTCKSEGHVTKIEKIVQNGTVLNSAVEFDYVEEEKEYEFDILTIPVYGYAGFEIPFTNTTGAINLVTYYYTYGSVVNSNLINVVKFSLANSEDEQLQTNGHVLFQKDVDGNLTGIYFQKEFGARRAIQILASIPELGISHIITLDVRPNVKIDISPSTDNPIVRDPIGLTNYNGVQLLNVYSESIYKVEVTMEYTVWSNTLNDIYYFEIYDTDPKSSSGVAQRVGKDNNGYVRIIQIERTNNGETQLYKGSTLTSTDIKRLNSDREGIIKYVFYFMFTSQQESNSKVLILTLRKDTSTSVDIQKNIYINLNQNVNVSVKDNNDVYLKTLNTEGEYGKVVLFGEEDSKIVLSRIVNNGNKVDDETQLNIDAINISLVKVVLKNENDEHFEIRSNDNKYTLISKSPITNYVQIPVLVLYNDVIIKQLDLIIRPDLQLDNSQQKWVIYGKDSDEYYLKFINGNTYSNEYILTAFKHYYNDFNTAIPVSVRIDLSNDLIRPYLDYSNGEYTAKSVKDNLLYGEFLTGSIIFKNAASGGDGDIVNFKIMILPTYLPLVIYRDADNNIIDTSNENLYNLLDVEFLATSDKYYYTVKNAGSFETILFQADQNNDLFMYNVSYNGDDATLTETSDNVVGMQFVNTDLVYYSIQNLDDNDQTDYAYFSFVNDANDENKKTGILKAQQVGKETFVVLYCSLNELAANKLIVPYLIKIPKELEIKTYYPYVQGASNNNYSLKGENLLLNNPTFDMEYLSFEVDPQTNQSAAYLDLTEIYSEDIPNQKYGRRYVIGKYIDNEFVKVTNLSSLSEVTFKVAELWYYAPGWRQATNVNDYATFERTGLLKILPRGGVSKIRLRIEITTRSGILACYYVSVGEVPSLYLTDENGDNPGDTYTILANTETILVGINHSNKTFKLSKSLDRTVTDATNLINFYSYDEQEYQQENEPYIIIDNARKVITASQSTKNWSTNLLVYTIYGKVQDLTLNITSDYNLAFVPDQESKLVYNSIENVYEVSSGNTIDIKDYFVLTQNGSSLPVSVLSYQILFNNDNYPQIYTDNNDELATNSKIYIGSVLSTTEISVYVNYIFDQGEYNFTFILKVSPVVRIGYTNGLAITANNMLGVLNVETAKANQELDILNKLFTFENDFDFANWFKNNEQSKLDFILFTANLGNGFVATLNDDCSKVLVTTQLVATVTRVSFKVALRNKIEDGSYVDLFSSYFTFTISPTFKLVVNYPHPNETAIVSGETFLYDTNNTTINLNSSALFETEENKRVRIVDLNDNNVNSEILDKIYVKVKSGQDSDASILNIADEYTQLSNASYEIIKERVGVSSSVIFEIKFLVDDTNRSSEEGYFTLGTYRVVVERNGLQNVFTPKVYNFNSTSISRDNNESNAESIYVGTKDNILSKILVTISVPSNAVLTQPRYLEIKEIGGLQVKGSVISIVDGAQGEKINTYVYFESGNFDFTLTPKDENFVNYQVKENQNMTGEDVGFVDESGNLLKATFDLQSRIKIDYKTPDSIETVDLYRLYKVLLKPESVNINESEKLEDDKFAKSIEIEGFKDIDEFNYWVIYQFDVQFETDVVTLSAGESTTLIKDSDSIVSDYYLSTLNMKHVSNSTYYTKSDFNASDVHIKNVDITKMYYTEKGEFDINGNPTPCENLGYLSIAPFMNSERVIQDYIFIAMGAPRDTSVTLIVEITIGHGSSKEKTFVVTFIVSNDYVNEYLRNSDNTINTQASRNRLAAGRSYTIAKAGSTIMLENYVYIRHQNITSEIYEGNVASFFGVIFDNAGKDYISSAGTDANNNLIISFKEIEFGNILLDVTLRDAYGYEITYYIQIIAKYNPIYERGDITVYECDKVAVIDKSKSDIGDVSIPIKIENRNEQIYNDMKIGDDNVEVSIKFEVLKGENLYEEIPNIFKEEPNTNKEIIFYLDFISDEYFQNNVDFLEGRILLYLSDTLEDSVPSVITINTIIKERYSISSSSSPYVREGVEFSLLDVVDVVDNKSNISIGERSIRSVKSLYLEYEVELCSGDSVIGALNPDNALVGDNPFVNNFTLQIKAKNISTGEVKIVPIACPSGSYISLEELFGLTDVSSYNFSLYRLVNDGVIPATDDSQPIKGFWDTPIVEQNEYNSSSCAWKTNLPSFRFMINNGEYTYLIQITECYIVDDQFLSISTSSLQSKPDISIWLYDNTTKTIEVLNSIIKADKIETKNISLRSLKKWDENKKLDFSLYTKEDRSVINGISNIDLLRLKGIKFTGRPENPSSEEEYAMDVISENNTVVKYITLADGEFKVSTDGNNILYDETNLDINVEYAFSNGEAMKTKQHFKPSVKVTLKYVAVDTTRAYGSDYVKKIEYQGDSGKDSFMNNGVPISVWAGNERRPVTVVAGYTETTEFATEEDSTLVANADAFEYSISTIETTELYARMEGSTLKLEDDFNFDINYVDIDIKVKYGEGGTLGSIKVGSIRVRFRNVEETSLRIGVKAQKLVASAGERTGGYIQYSTSILNVANMIELFDRTDVSWTGQDIIDIYGSRLSFVIYQNRLVKKDGNEYVDIDDNGVETSVEVVPFSRTNPYLWRATSSVVKIAILDSKGDGELEVFEDIQIVKNEFEANCIIAKDYYSFGYENISVVDEVKPVMMEKLSKLVRFTNIYNVNKYLPYNTSFVDILSNDSGNSYTIVQNNTAEKLGAKVVYTVTYGYKNNDENSLAIIYGSVIVRVYESKQNETIDGFARSYELEQNSILDDIWQPADQNLIDFSYDTEFNGRSNYVHYFANSNSLNIEFAEAISADSLNVSHDVSLDIGSEDFASYLDEDDQSILHITMNGAFNDVQKMTITIIIQRPTEENPDATCVYVIVLYRNIVQMVSESYNIPQEMIKYEFVADERYITISEEYNSILVNVNNLEVNAQEEAIFNLYYTFVDEESLVEYSIILYQIHYSFTKISNT